MTFHPVVRLPERVDAIDLSGGPRLPRMSPYCIGGYAEVRPSTYPAWFGARSLHMGLDIGGPAGTEVFAFRAGEVVHRGYVPGAGDYGWALVTEHVVEGAVLWVFYGHLAAEVTRWRPGDAFEAGARLALFGAPHENGGWPPHLHLQLCTERPDTVDVPGVYAPAERARAEILHPDPRRIFPAAP